MISFDRLYFRDELFVSRFFRQPKIMEFGDEAFDFQELNIGDFSSQGVSQFPNAPKVIVGANAIYTQSNGCNPCDQNFVNGRGRIRFFNNVAGGPRVNVKVNGVTAITNLPYGGFTKFRSIRQGSHNIIAQAVNTNGTVLDTNISTSRNGSYSLLMTGLVNSSSGGFQPLVLQNRCARPRPGTVELRLIHGAAGVGAVDLFEGSQRLFNNVRFATQLNPQYVTISPGEKRFFITAANSIAPISAPISVFLSSGGVYSLVLTGITNDSQFPLSAILSTEISSYEGDVFQRPFTVASYMGLWYEIASIPRSYEIGCARATAKYEFLSNGQFRITNSCFDTSGSTLRSAVGTASIIDPNTPAALYVNFSSTSVTNPIANYLVHKTNYTSYAIVGSPDRVSFWILSRCPTMKVSNYQKILSYAEFLGYNTDSIQARVGAVPCLLDESCANCTTNTVCGDCVNYGTNLASTEFSATASASVTNSSCTSCSGSSGSVSSATGIPIINGLTGGLFTG